MRPTRKLFGKSLRISSFGILAFTGAAQAGEFTWNSVITETTGIESGTLTFLGADEIVVGTGGTVATISVLNNGSNDLKYVTLNSTNGSAATKIIARPGTSGTLTLSHGTNTYHTNSPITAFGEFAGLALTETGGLRLTFTAEQDNISNPPKGLFQATVSGNTITPGTILYQSSYTLDTDTGISLPDVHAQVNTQGVVAYQAASGSNQAIFSSASGTPVITSADLKNFNRVPASVDIKRIAIASDGSVVYRATKLDDSATGIYRNNSLTPVVSGLSTSSRLIEASSSHVLYTKLSGSVESLYLAPDNGVAVQLSSYDRGSVFGGKAVMTQQNRLAFFDLDGSADNVGHETDATLQYYDANNSIKKTVAYVGQTVGTSFTIKNFYPFDNQIDPKLNDRGKVVYDAILSSTDNHDVQAILVWDSQTQTSKIVVKVDLTDGTYSDMYTVGNTDYAVTGISISTSREDVAYGPLKDALSEDNWLAFGLSYFDGSTDRQVIISTLVPEPTAAGLMLSVGAAAMLRRRRRL